MAAITTRAAKGEPLTFKEVDDNFLSLNETTGWVYRPIDTIFLIPNNPNNGDLIEIFDSTGIESLLIIQGVPAGFIGSNELIVRLRYSSAAGKWIWLNFVPKNPDARYLKRKNWLLNGNMAVNQRLLGATKLEAELLINVSTGTFTLDPPTAGHGLAAADRVRFFATDGALPSPLVPDTDYYVISSGLTVTAFKVSATSGGTAIDLTGTAGGEYRVWSSNVQSFPSSVQNYSIDCWYGYPTGGTVTGRQIKELGSGKYQYEFTGGSGVTAINFGQRIEGRNCVALAGSVATLSVRLANSSLSAVNWAVYRADVKGQFGTNASPKRTLFASGSFTVTPTLTRYAATFSVPASANTGIEVVFSVGAQAAGTSWTIADAQFESGPNATTLEPRGFEDELQSCQRYYQTGIFSATRALSDSPASQIAGGTVYFSTELARVPNFQTAVGTSLNLHSLAYYGGLVGVNGVTILLLSQPTSPTEPNTSVTGTYYADASLL